MIRFRDIEHLLAKVGKVEVRHGFVVASNEIGSDDITNRIFGMDSDSIPSVVIPGIVDQVHCKASVEPIKVAAATEGCMVVQCGLTSCINVLLSDELHSNWNFDWVE